MDIRKRIQEVLEKGYIMSLGTMDDGGVWVADVSYFSDDDLKIYWRSEDEVRHSKAIETNPRVSVAITVNKPGEDNFGVQIGGVAGRIEGGRLDLQQKYARKRGKPMPIKEDPMTSGISWYVLTPKLIELIDEENFGFEKQAIDLM